ncbi:MAG TPA: stage III sporulation protein AE [Firmicutes bacterium]|nr:stage III sporulation protein AE [Bacillota bacterium]
MKGKHVFLLILFLCLCSVPAGAFEYEELLAAQIDELGLEELYQATDQLDDEAKKLLPSLHPREILAGEGLGQWDPVRLAESLLQYLVREIVYNLRLFGRLIAVVILCALLQSLQKATKESGVIDVSFGVSFLVMAYISIESFKAAVAIGTSAIDGMVSFMQALIPVMSSLLVAVGGVGSAAVLHPVFYLAINWIAFAVDYWFIPLVAMATVLGIMGNLSKDLTVDRFAALLKQGGMAVLGLLSAVFLGITAVQGKLAPVSDGVGLRTAKFVSTTFVPVVGNLFSNAMDTVVGGALLLKNAVGVFGLITVAVVVAFPLVKLFALILVYRVVAALAEPFSDPRLVKIIQCLESSLCYIFGGVAVVALMFFLTITVMVSAGNLAALVR